MIKYIALILCAVTLANTSATAVQQAKQQTEKTTEETTVVTQQAPETPTSPTAQPKYPEMEQEVLLLINNNREQAGVTPLQIEYAYYDCAYTRATECLEYWSHTRPDGRASYTVYYDFNKADGIKIMGENLAKNFQTSESIMQALMDSPSHRKTILFEEYTHVTICIIEVEGYENLYAMSQLFTKKA